MSQQPKPRPALKKSPDSTVPTVVPTLSPRSTTELKHRAKAGSATSDTLRPRKDDKAVELTVTIPKSMRKRLKQVAAEAGMKPERLAAQLIADYVGR